MIMGGWLLWTQHHCIGQDCVFPQMIMNNDILMSGFMITMWKVMLGRIWWRLRREYDEVEEDGDYYDNIPSLFSLLKIFNLQRHPDPLLGLWHLRPDESDPHVWGGDHHEGRGEKDFLTQTPQWINLNHYYELWTIIANRSISSCRFWRRISACCPQCTQSVNWRTNRFCHNYYCDGHQGQQMLSTMSTKY